MPGDRGEYRVLFCSFWHNPDVIRLSHLAYRVLTTLKGTLPASGIGVVYVEQLAAQCADTPKNVEAALVELQRPTGSNPRGWILREQNIVWIINGLRFEPTLKISNVNHRKFIQRSLWPFGSKAKIIKAFRAYYAAWFPNGEGIPSGGDSDGIPMPFEWDLDPVTVTVTETVTETVTDPVTATNPTRVARKKQKRAQPSLESPLFAIAWINYPKRAGSNPRAEAWQQWRTRITEGVAESDMVAGTERFRAFQEAMGKVGTSYVMQAKRFFGPAREFENEWEIPPQLPFNPNGKAQGSHRNDAALDAWLADKEAKRGAGNGE